VDTTPDVIYSLAGITTSRVGSDRGLELGVLVHVTKSKPDDVNRSRATTVVSLVTLTGEEDVLVDVCAVRSWIVLALVSQQAVERPETRSRGPVFLPCFRLILVVLDFPESTNGIKHWSSLPRKASLRRNNYLVILSIDRSIDCIDFLPPAETSKQSFISRMSDLAPFLVAAAVRDQVVTDLQEEVSKLHQEKQQLQKLAAHYKTMYERNHPFRTVSLVLLPPSMPPSSQANSSSNGGTGEASASSSTAATQALTTLASCRVNLDHALSSGMVQVFEGHADAAIPVEDFGKVELRIGDATTACRLVDLTARSVMYFQCIASSHFFLRFVMEQGPDLMLEAGIGPLTHQEYCAFFRIQMSDMNAAANSENEGLIGCNMLDARDRVSRPIDLSRLVSFFSTKTTGAGSGEAAAADDGVSSTTSTMAMAAAAASKYVKFMFDDNRMSSDFLFEYLETPYDPSGIGGGEDDDHDYLDDQPMMVDDIGGGRD
jgi:hypothetical protein